mmetsp:Transcript_11831/g.22646  ORF Transcript_11831/g.22646 Transcript_11831/m.22646 type:complete len:565 (-) Transcript_11831:104-1798(-)
MAQCGSDLECSRFGITDGRVSFLAVISTTALKEKVAHTHKSHYAETQNVVGRVINRIPIAVEFLLMFDSVVRRPIRHVDPGIGVNDGRIVGRVLPYLVTASKDISTGRVGVHNVWQPTFAESLRVVPLGEGATFGLPGPIKPAVAYAGIFQGDHLGFGKASDKGSTFGGQLTVKVRRRTVGGYSLHDELEQFTRHGVKGRTPFGRNATDATTRLSICWRIFKTTIGNGVFRFVGMADTVDVLLGTVGSDSRGKDVVNVRIQIGIGFVEPPRVVVKLGTSESICDKNLGVLSQITTGNYQSVIQELLVHIHVAITKWFVEKAKARDDIQHVFLGHASGNLIDNTYRTLDTFGILPPSIGRVFDTFNATVIKTILRPRCRMQVGPHLETFVTGPFDGPLQSLPALADNPWLIALDVTQDPVGQWDAHMGKASLFNVGKVLLRHEMTKVSVKPCRGHVSIFKRRGEMPFVNGIIGIVENVFTQIRLTLVKIATLRRRRRGRCTQGPFVPTQVGIGFGLDVTIRQGKLIRNNVTFQDEPSTEVNASDPTWILWRGLVVAVLIVAGLSC